MISQLTLSATATLLISHYAPPKVAPSRCWCGCKPPSGRVVYRRSEDEPAFVEVPAPTDEDLQALSNKIMIDPRGVKQKDALSRD